MRPIPFRVGSCRRSPDYGVREAGKGRPAPSQRPGGGAAPHLAEGGKSVAWGLPEGRLWRGHDLFFQGSAAKFSMGGPRKAIELRGDALPFET